MAAAGRYGLSTHFALAVDAAVAHELPDPTVGRGDPVGVVVVAICCDTTAKELCGDLRRFGSGDACELDLNAEVVGKQFDMPSFLADAVRRLVFEGIRRHASQNERASRLSSLLTANRRKTSFLG